MEEWKDKVILNEGESLKLDRSFLRRIYRKSPDLHA